MQKIKLFTHNDLDGEGCAILFSLKYGNDNVDIERCSVYEVDDKVREFINSDFVGVYSRIFITDISLKDEELLDTIDRKYSELFVIIDHHKTALHLNKYQWCLINETHLNGSKASGTSLVRNFLEQETYETFNSTISNLVETIRSYDTWEWTLNNNVEADDLNLLYRLKGHAYLYNKFTDVNIVNGLWSSLFSADELDCITQERENCKRYIENRLKKVKHTEIQGMSAGVVFAEQYINDVAQEMYTTLDIDIAVVIDLGKERMSFRCKKDVPMLEYVQSIGGGGHPKACGASIDSIKIEEFISKLF